MGLIMNNILITGATSAAGIASINWLYKKWPESRIIALGRPSKRLDSIKELFNVETVPIDLEISTDEFKAQTKNLTLPKIDIFFHLATKNPSVSTSPEQFYRVNFINSVALVKSIPFSQKALVLNFSTASVYSQRTKKLSERSKKTTSCHYGISKRLFEQFLQEISSLSGQKRRFLSVRIPVLLAPNIQHNFLSKWKKLLLNNDQVSLSNPNSNFNSCVLLDDILKFSLKFYTQNNVNHLICNVSSKDPISIQSVYRILSTHMNRIAQADVVETAKFGQFYDHSLAVKYGFEPSSVSTAIKEFATY